MTRTKADLRKKTDDGLWLLKCIHGESEHSSFSEAISDFNVCLYWVNGSKEPSRELGVNWIEQVK